MGTGDPLPRRGLCAHTRAHLVSMSGRMEKSFDPVRYVVGVGRELVASFAQASQATSPGQVGSARETPTRRRLKTLLPNGVAVGSGFVIDSYRGTSRQMDVVLYEEHICPSYSINDDVSTTYYPCEGVIAVGEVKSDIGSSELEDVFAKIESVKRLHRHGVAEDDGLGPVVPFRKYGSQLSIASTEANQFDQANKAVDQVFGFALAGTLKLRSATACEKFFALSTEVGWPLSPNLIVTLEDEQILCPLSIAGGK